MAITFPVDLDSYLPGLRINLSDLAPSDNLITSTTRGGQQLSAEVGNVMWQGTAQMTDYYHDDADAIRAKLAVLRRAGASLLIGPRHRLGPIADPQGLILGAATPVIHTLDAGNAALRIAGLPPGYVISGGDYLSFTYGTSPLRYAMHHVAVGGVANGSGLTPLIEVTPHIRPGALIGAAVRLVRPVFKAVLSNPPGYGSMRPMFTGGMGFAFVQTLGG